MGGSQILKEKVVRRATLRLCVCTRVGFSSHLRGHTVQVHVVTIDCNLDLCGYVGQQPTISMDILSVAIQYGGGRASSANFLARASVKP